MDANEQSGNERESIELNNGHRKRIGLILGPVVFAFLLLLPVTETFTVTMRSAAACTGWVAVWWVSEAVPIPATSLLPLVLFPVMGVLPFEQTTQAYASPNVFLFLGGFMLAVTMQKWNLHRRAALVIISLAGTRPSRLILGFMVATGFLSMWISNTATAMMMIPIGLSLIGQLGRMATGQGLDIDTRSTRFSFGTALMLGIAYSATVGGVGTLIGTPPNAIFASVASDLLGQEITFARWMLFGFPLATVFTLLCWVYLVRVFPLGELDELKGGHAVISEQIAELGPMSKGEKMVLAVVSSVAIMWTCRSLFLQSILPGLTDPAIAVLGALLLFVLPENWAQKRLLLDWDTAVKIPWGILLLFGGGICIAAGFTETGLASYLGQQLAGLNSIPLIFIMMSVVALVVFMSNVTSNTGTVSMMLPAMVAMAVAMRVHPYALMVSAATAGSFAFMLPVGTPPNAIVFGSQQVTITQMVKAGLFLTIVAIIVIPIVVYFYLPLVWGIDIVQLPGWYPG